MHRVVVVALPGVVTFDLSTPEEVFSRVRLPNAEPGYRVRVCGAQPQVDAGGYQLRLNYTLRELQRADTIILPGVADISAEVPEALVRAVRRAAARGVRVASICTGAFLLAATGLLQGLRATTHWLAAPELARRYPEIEVDPNVLFVDAGKIMTSAGAAAGLDLCLHMVQRDYGAAVAAEAARISVMPLQREGGQAQFIQAAPPVADHVALSHVLEWMQENLHRDLTLHDVAQQAAVSVRSLNRHFREQTGTTPLQWLLRARVRRAQALLETTADSVEQVATNAGFGSATSLRQHFRRVVGTSPQAYRRAFAG